MKASLKVSYVSKQFMIAILETAFKSIIRGSYDEWHGRTLYVFGEFRVLYLAWTVWE